MTQQATNERADLRARAIAALRTAAAMVYNQPTCQIRIRRLGWALAQLEALEAPQEQEAR